jgi:hypothetical protein
MIKKNIYTITKNNKNTIVSMKSGKDLPLYMFNNTLSFFQLILSIFLNVFCYQLLCAFHSQNKDIYRSKGAIDLERKRIKRAEHS